MIGERLEIVEVGSECRSTGFRRSDDQCVDGRTSTGLPAEQRGAARQRFGDLLHDIARLQEAVRDRVATGMTLQTLNEDD